MKCGVAMRPNICGIDRTARFIIGGVFLALALTGVFTGTAATASIVVGVMLMGTGLVRRCLMYVPMGVSTCNSKKGN
jgi:hypothetical protein